MKELLLVAITVTVAILGAHWLSLSSCEEKSRSFEEHQYSFVGGCMVKHKGMWLPLDNIRGFD